MAYTKLIPRFTLGAGVDAISHGSAYRLSIPSGEADKYRSAQLDDYAQLSRRRFPHRFDLHLGLLARTSSDSIPGTWGFGMWNDPFGLSLGFGGSPFRLPALPNAVWFFGASKENYLSFKSLLPVRSEAQSKSEPPGNSSFQHNGSLHRRASTTDFATNAQPSAQRGIPANGFLAQTFRSPWFHPLLILAGLALPFSRKTTRRLMGKVIGEEGVVLSVDPTQWHRYKLEWRENRASFEVDGVLVFESPVSPKPPLGLVIWIDNQYAAFTPDGKIAFGVLASPEPAWLEINELDVGTGPSL